MEHTAGMNGRTVRALLSSVFSVFSVLGASAPLDSMSVMEAVMRRCNCIAVRVLLDGKRQVGSMQHEVVRTLPLGQHRSY